MAGTLARPAFLRERLVVFRVSFPGTHQSRLVLVGAVHVEVDNGSVRLLQGAEAHTAFRGGAEC